MYKDICSRSYILSYMSNIYQMFCVFSKGTRHAIDFFFNYIYIHCL